MWREFLFRKPGDPDRSQDSWLRTSPRVAMKIFVDKIFRGNFAERSKPLRTPWSHPDKISHRNRIPAIAEPVNSAAFEHDEPVLHHVHFDHAQGCTRLVHHRVYGEIKAHLVGQQTFHLQAGIVFERMRGDRVFTGYNTSWRLDRAENLVRFLNHSHAARLHAEHPMRQSLGQISVAPRSEFAGLAFQF